MFLVGEMPDKAGVVLQRRLRPFHLIIKNRVDLEYFLEIFLVLIQHVVDVLVADEDDFHVHWDGFRLQGGRRQLENGFTRLNFDLPAQKYAFQCFPYTRLGHGVERVENEIASVGAQERTRLDLREIRHPHPPHIEDLFNRTENVRVCLLCLHDDRHVRRHAVVEQEVD